MKKFLALVLALVLGLSLFACGETNTDESAESGTESQTDGKTYTVAVPNDATNEGRALLLLEAQGLIKLKADAGITATILDIEENPYNLDFKEMEAAQLPRVLAEVDYAVINSNYAISAEMNPVKDSLFMEGSESAYANILACKEGEEGSDKIRALVAALESEEVKKFIEEKYAGSVVSVVETTTDGYNADVNYESLAGTTIKVAASPTPHAEILAIAKDILAKKNITLEVKEFDDYVLPNNVVESGEMDANYFQHVPYLDDFNKENGTHIVSASAVHVEPMGFYGGLQKDLKPFGKE